MRTAKDQWPEVLASAGTRGLLRQLAAGLKDGTDADDLAQEVYLRLLRADDALVIRDPRSFALRVASNVACEWGRLARHRRPHLEQAALAGHVAPGAGPAEQAELDQQLEVCTRALEAMTSKRRAVVLLRVRDGLSYAEIAARTGLSMSMVYKHLSLGLAACQQALGTGDHGGGIP